MFSIGIGRVFAQKDTVLLYMKDSFEGYNVFNTGEGEPALNKEEATFVRVLMSPVSGNGLYRVNDYYLNGKLKFSGESLSPTWDTQLDGTCVAYFENGHKKKICNYNKGALTGDVMEYFPNGRLNTVKTVVDKGVIGADAMPPIILKQCLDSLGKIMTDEGNGKWAEYHGSNIPFAEGIVKTGVEDGEWRGRLNDTINYTCTYSMGSLKKGSSVSSTGQVYHFTQIASLPEFPGGVEKFGAYLGKTLSYPADARENGVQGRVILRFVIRKDGTLSDIKVARTLYPSLDLEALKALKKSPNWLPGYKYGIKTDVVYMIPVSFTMVNDNSSITPAN